MYVCVLIATLYLLQKDFSAEAGHTGQCGGTLTLTEVDTSINVTTSNSAPTGGAAFCNWRIYSPSDTKVIVQFKDLRLYNNDELTIYDSIGRTMYNAIDLRRNPHVIFSDSSYAAHPL